MTKFGSSFMMNTPLKQMKKAKRLRDKAMKISSETETGDFDRENPRVNRLLERSKKASEKSNAPRAGAEAYEDARIAASYERPDMDVSPFNQNGAYSSGAGGMVYASNRESFQNLFNTITQATNKIVDARKDPEAVADRLDKRVARRNKRAGTKGEATTYKEDASGKKVVDKKGDAKRDKFDQKTKDIETRATTNRTKAQNKRKTGCGPAGTNTGKVILHPNGHTTTCA